MGHDESRLSLKFQSDSLIWNILLKFIFTFLRSGVEAKRWVLPTRNASRIRQKVDNGVFFTRFPLPNLLCAGYSVKLKVSYNLSLNLIGQIQIFRYFLFFYLHESITARRAIRSTSIISGLLATIYPSVIVEPSQ